jgi:hypothetical protein
MITKILAFNNAISFFFSISKICQIWYVREKAYCGNQACWTAFLKVDGWHLSTDLGKLFLYVCEEFPLF